MKANQKINRDEQTIRDNARPISDEKFASPRWDISQERAFIENLVGQRTSFLLVFFGLVVAGGVNARGIPLAQNAIFVFGTLVVFLLTLTIERAQKKLDLIIDFLKSDPTHPVAVIDIIAGPSGSKRRIIGYWLPWLCTFALLLASLASWFGAIQATETQPQLSLTCSLAHDDTKSSRRRDDADPTMPR